MTAKEAIDWLMAPSCLSNGDATDPVNKHWEAYRMAIEALKREPCDDAISRKAVINTLYAMDKSLDTERTVEEYKSLLEECYKVLPSVQPKTTSVLCEDAISRKDAKISLMQFMRNQKSLCECIDDCPSVQLVEFLEPILDKIRAEIDNALSDGMIHKQTVLGIIDKYKAEIEPQESEKI